MYIFSGSGSDSDSGSGISEDGSDSGSEEKSGSGNNSSADEEDTKDGMKSDQNVSAMDTDSQDGIKRRRGRPKKDAIMDLKEVLWVTYIFVLSECIPYIYIYNHFHLALSINKSFWLFSSCFCAYLPYPPAGEEIPPELRAIPWYPGGR